jgi:hypothetical protein
MSITSFPALVRISEDGNAISVGGTSADAFGRLRVSPPVTIFDSQHRYEKNGLFDEAVAGSATVTYSSNESTVLMNVTSASGDEVVRQSLRSFAYQPGKSLLVMNTFVMPAAHANLRCRVGYFSSENGVFLERSGATTSFVRRSYASGGVVDTSVAQASWNGDRLDGTGPSGYTLDLTKSQILWQDFEWLGVGSVRIGFVINGKFIVAHTFHHANNLAVVYMTTAILPIRYEITNTGATDGSRTMRQICSTVISEGGYEKKVKLQIGRMTTSNTNVGTTLVPLLSLRLDPTRPNAVVIHDGYRVLPTASASTTFEIQLVKNATLTGPSWAQTSSNNVEFDVTATAMTGGIIVDSLYVRESTLTSSSVSNSEDYNFDLQFGSTIAGVSDIYTLAARTLSGTQSAIATFSFWDLT